jgi:hypothetical protein
VIRPGVVVAMILATSPARGDDGFVGLQVDAFATSAGSRTSTVTFDTQTPPGLAKAQLPLPRQFAGAGVEEIMGMGPVYFGFGYAYEHAIAASSGPAAVRAASTMSGPSAVSDGGTMSLSRIRFLTLGVQLPTHGWALDLRVNTGIDIASGWATVEDGFDHERRYHVSGADPFADVQLGGCHVSAGLEPRTRACGYVGVTLYDGTWNPGVIVGMSFDVAGKIASGRHRRR